MFGSACHWSGSKGSVLEGATSLLLKEKEPLVKSKHHMGSDPLMVFTFARLLRVSFPTRGPADALLEVEWSSKKLNMSQKKTHQSKPTEAKSHRTKREQKAKEQQDFELMGGYF